MPDYKKMYLIMARSAEKAVRLTEEATEILIDAQRECEDLYINAPEPAVTLLRPDRESDNAQ